MADLVEGDSSICVGEGALRSINVSRRDIGR